MYIPESTAPEITPEDIKMLLATIRVYTENAARLLDEGDARAVQILSMFRCTCDWAESHGLNLPNRKQLKIFQMSGGITDEGDLCQALRRYADARK